MRNILVIIGFLAISVSGYAYSQVQNWLSLSPMVYTSLQLDDSNFSTPKLGVGGALGFNYQLQSDKFIVELGLEAAYVQNRVGLQDTEWRYDMIDTRGESFVLKTALKDRVDMCNTLSVRVPLMAGMELQRFYWMAGARVSMALMNSGRSEAKLTTSGLYDKYYDEIVNVPSHGFGTEKIKSEHKFMYGLDVRPVLELGVVLNNQAYSYRNKGNKMHLGVYAEFGVLNTLPDKNKATSDLYKMDFTSGLQVKMNHLHMTTQVNRMNTLEIGLRYKVFFYVRSNKKRIAY